MSTYIIPDIHGCIKTLRSLIECRLNIKTSDCIYFLGDYIDRGPDSAGVVDYIIGLKESGVDIQCLMGNHEQMLINSVLGETDMMLWMINSGMETLKSYGIRSNYQLNILNSITPRHLEFYKSLKHFFIVKDRYILVHGGINYSAQSPFADTEALLWSKPMPVPDSFMPGCKIIHGHTVTPISRVINDVQNKQGRIFGLDAGCVFKGYYPGTGYLTALNLEKWKLDFVECIDQ